ncbi:MAG TPA: hypothetical protein P5141_05505 [Candidatus Hydrogenedentes bacterium]|nr:hypothetical protein [Candidatus Hydrogenedentota bacterium]
MKVAEAFAAFMRGRLPWLPSLLGRLPDHRRPDMCRYSAAHLCWQALLMFLCRSGSRNAFDQSRNSGALPAALGAACGSDAGAVTCGDNAARFLKRLAPEHLELVLLAVVARLFESRAFDGSRVPGGLYAVVLDGTVREKCRKGFEGGGKASGKARYRYVLQASVLLRGRAVPVMHEHVDVEDPVSEKEDCEINAAKRLLPRLKAAFPHMPFVILGDALYACRPVAAECRRHGWRFCLTFKEGRTPEVWREAVRLMGLEPGNRLSHRDRPASDPASRHSALRWIGDIDFSEKGGGPLAVTAVEEIETVAGEQTLYAWITDVPGLGAGNILGLIHATGRERHTIEDQFNVQKNNGFGLEHVFCADATAGKNYYALMQLAYLLWTLFYHGLLTRLHAWAGKTAQATLARLLLDGLRATGAADPGWRACQLRFVT